MRVVTIRDWIRKRGSIIKDMITSDPPVVTVKNGSSAPRSFIVSDMAHYADLATRAGEIELGREVSELRLSFKDEMEIERPKKFRELYLKRKDKDDQIHIQADN